MNVSANSYNRNTNDYVELACLLLLSTTAGSLCEIKLAWQ